MPDTDQICPQCGARLKPGWPGGLCLRCLLSFGLKPDAAETRGDSAGKPLVPPDGIIAGEFDRFHVLEKIGEGGCGVVYRAEQLQPVQREVALKVIKLGMDTQNVIARFEIERQALARMDHPNIARVFDAGSTRAGRPFFAMELVRGERITDYCDRHCLNIPHRLELFARVCEAVQHAHQKGVIHRDLKPSNVLVTDADGPPQPKIIDFGVAKATARQRLADQTIYTTFDQFVGTPAYMSPEQAGLTGEDVDTRSDIYSLGVLLYELLTGRPPFDPEQLRRAALNELCRILREQEPARPSAQLTALNEANLTEVARRRSAAPARLVRKLRGDLDWIVMRALEKDRARRYETANGLAMDIHRLLKNEPVMACPPTAAYRARKFIGKHRRAVAAAAVFVILLVGAAAAGTLLALRAIAERDRAVQAEQQATAIQQFLLNHVIHAARLDGELGGLGRDVTVRAALDAAEPGIASTFQQQPRVEAAIREALGTSYLHLGDAAKAIRQFERVRALHSQLPVAPKEEQTTRSSLATAYLSAGRLPDYVQTLEEAWQWATQVYGPNAPETLSLQGTLGVAYRDVKRHGDAVRTLSLGVERAERALGPEHQETLNLHNALAFTYLAQGRPEAAIPLMERVLELRQGNLGPDNYETTRIMVDLARTYQAAARWTNAQPLFQAAHEIRHRVHGADNASTLIALEAYAAALEQAGLTAEAENRWRESLLLREPKYGLDHPASLLALQSLARLLDRTGRTSEAEPILRRVHNDARTRYGLAHPETLRTLSVLLDALTRLGRADESHSMLDEVAAGLGDSNLPDAAIRADLLQRLSRVFAEAGRATEAEQISRRAQAAARMATNNSPFSVTPQSTP